MKKHALSLLLAAAVLAVPLHQAAAQKMEQPPMRGGGGHGHRGGGGGGWGGLATGLAIGVATGIILSQPPAGATEAAPQRAQRPNQPQRNARGSGVPAAGETRMVPDEVVIELPNTVPAATLNSVQQRHRLTRLESQTVTLTGTTFYRWRIPDRRSVAAVVRALEARYAHRLGAAELPLHPGAGPAEGRAGRAFTRPAGRRGGQGAVL